VPAERWPGRGLRSLTRYFGRRHRPDSSGLGKARPSELGLWMKSRTLAKVTGPHHRTSLEGFVASLTDRGIALSTTGGESVLTGVQGCSNNICYPNSP
jgi:hypothetical protein